jgi:uncharacterized Tic20 family protein
MKQPELGLKVAELRQVKGLTQEQLAEACEVSPRTIQRIESGEVDPRSFTINSLSKTLDFDFGVSELENEGIWLAALHLSSIFCFLPVSLAVWAIKKNQSYKVEKQGKAALNFQLTILLSLLALGFCVMIAPLVLIYSNLTVDLGFSIGLMEIFLICFTVPLFPLGIFTFYQGIANTVRSLNGQEIRYPLSINFVK